MSLFDGRHRWGPVLESGAKIIRTCRVCGRTDTYEKFLPDIVVESIVQHMRRPNPYRTLVQRNP